MWLIAKQVEHLVRRRLVSDVRSVIAWFQILDTQEVPLSCLDFVGKWFQIGRYLARKKCHWADWILLENGSKILFKLVQSLIINICHFFYWTNIVLYVPSACKMLKKISINFKFSWKICGKTVWIVDEVVGVSGQEVFPFICQCCESPVAKRSVSEIGNFLFLW